MLLGNQFAALVTLINDRLDQSFGTLSPRAASALLTLLNRGSLDVSTLAKIVGVTQPTATRLIDGLEKQGLSERCPRDGKAVLVRLTSTGRIRAEQLQSGRQACVQNMLEELSGQEQEVLARLIDKLLFTSTTGRVHARTTCRYCNHGPCCGKSCPINRKAAQLETS